MENAIKIKGVTKKYDSFQLDQVDLKLPAGYIMGIIGENGAGKTTVIKAMLGLVKLDAGQVELLGKPFDMQDRDLKEHIGVVMDSCNFPEDMKAKDIDRVMASCYRTWSSAAFHGYILKFRLPEDKKIKNYSSGMKMKLSIAVALSHDSRLLILDEATTGLDPIVRDEVLEIFRDFVQDERNSVFISSHILSDLEKICDYITFLHEGKVIFSESKDQLLETYGIVKCSKADFEAVDEAAVIACRESSFGVEALVKRAEVNPAFTIDDASIEDIMVYFVKEGTR